MKRGALWRVSVAITREAEDAVSELMSGIFGQTPSIYSDEETGATAATVYLESRDGYDAARKRQLFDGLRHIHDCGIEVGFGKITLRRVPRKDWAESWKRHFHPLEIGRALLIKPSWSHRLPRKGQAVAVLDPGLSFGTGQHATTEFCLRQLAKARRSGVHQSFLDIGTGSGILAISAAKLGYSPVEAFDFDPESIRVARENMKVNEVAEQIQLARRDLTRLPLCAARQHHVVCANLIYDLLIQERARILNRLRPDGVLVLAGILVTQFGRVSDAYAEAGLKLITSRVKKEWQSGAFVFR